MPTHAALGGVYKGGTFKPVITPGVPCSNCSGLTPANITITIAGATGPQSVWNGTWVVPQLPGFPCFWQLNLGVNYYIHASHSTGDWIVTVLVPIGNGAEFFLTIPDCDLPHALPKVFQSGGGTWPPTINLTPGP